MRQKLLGALAIGMLVAGCESTEPYKQDTDMKGNTFGDWPAPSASAEGPVPGSREDFQKNVGDRVFFDTNKSHIDSAAKTTLSNQAAWLKKWPSVDVIVEGHADQRGTEEYNMGLGQRRAAAAKKVLLSHGVPAKTIEIISYGKTRPEDSAHTAEAWAKNRRAVTVIR
ncbi:peptidoglycan-associated lipoprotein Pal [Candidatus Nucleicultrix amoebiphila]|jgi:peptidoglycan-associated lipoprotein|uniref:Peptidoglycan-associated lipoprotein n=1 Tax=Candidatus Nucleicultrix amoebiphila FS5 TaxID=1414854 RepID=A0A1W6N4B4_9PROT|nr:peptidoglycan-associated lipoprotein Pal [Candidatus Nucleicultrix amoebiphila]ARN84662.1 hypothetical protein GQ61_04355 [Candidatus Nucleicultrix amoebiphila FS5]